MQSILGAPWALAVITSQAPPPLSRPHPFPLVQPQEPSCKIFCFIQMRILEISCAIVHLHCYFIHIRPNQTSVDAYYATDNWAEGQTEQFGQLLLTQQKHVVHFSTPTGNCREFHHLCLEMPTTISDRSTCASSAYFETCWKRHSNSRLMQNEFESTLLPVSAAHDAAADFSAYGADPEHRFSHVPWDGACYSYLNPTSRCGKVLVTSGETFAPLEGVNEIKSPPPSV